MRLRHAALLLMLIAPAGLSHAETKLWYKRPAPRWDHGLPLGDGRLGAVVFGDARRARIQLNLSSLWMGGRRERDNPEALAHLNEVRRLLLAGQPQQAALLAEKKLMGRPHRLESYQTLGDLRLNFDHEETTQDYRLELDLDTATERLRVRAPLGQVVAEIRSVGRRVPYRVQDGLAVFDVAAGASYALSFSRAPAPSALNGFSEEANSLLIKRLIEVGVRFFSRPADSGR